MSHSQVLSVVQGGSYIKVCVMRVYFRFLSTKPGKLAVLDFYILLMVASEVNKTSMIVYRITFNIRHLKMAIKLNC